MHSVDLQVLSAVLAWRRQQHAVQLFTVIETWGSAPRLPGAMLAIRDDGQIVGSVSGGCVEDDLVQKVVAGMSANRPGFLVYGVSKEEAARFGLPCGGTLRLLYETVGDTQWVQELIARCDAHALTARRLSLHDGSIGLYAAGANDMLTEDDVAVTTIHGPRRRLLIIGAGQLSRCLAIMALMHDFEVIVCDPRSEYADPWDVPQTTLVRCMPDDAVLQLQLDSHSAVAALTHDPKLDDLMLLEALKSPAFYVGALGSRRNTASRRERLKLFDLDDSQIDRLHGPIGLRIGSRTPAEIAVAIMAEIIAVKNRFPLDGTNDKRLANAGPVIFNEERLS